jgi:threonyl-tRNA synthetase
MLHRAVLGSLERFLGVLLEHHQGALPAWLAPEQVVVAPIAEAHRGYAQGVLSRLVAAGVRARLDARPESLGRRLAEAHAAGAALFVVLGQREVDGEAIALRRRDGSQRAMPLEEGLAEVTRCCQPPV